MKHESTPEYPGNNKEGCSDRTRERSRRVRKVTEIKRSPRRQDGTVGMDIKRYSAFIRCLGRDHGTSILVDLQVRILDRTILLSVLQCSPNLPSAEPSICSPLARAKVIDDVRIDSGSSKTAPPTCIIDTMGEAIFSLRPVLTSASSGHEHVPAGP